MVFFWMWNCLISCNIGYFWKVWVYKWKVIKINFNIIVFKIFNSVKFVFVLIVIKGSKVYL